MKICGLTRLADAELACELGTDAVGFIFYRKSPRWIAPAEAAAICSALPDHVARVGVFVAPTEAELSEVFEAIDPDVIQIHGDVAPEAMPDCGGAARVRALQVTPEFSQESVKRWTAFTDAILLDGFAPGQHGGTGQRVSTRLARTAGEHARIILAGGISAQNAADAVREATPYALDVNSGIESAPGLKDAAQMQALFQNLRDFRRDWFPAENRCFPFS